MSIYSKLLQIQRESIYLKKDANNPFFNSDYITLDNILSTYNEILSTHGIVCVHYTKDNKLVTELYEIDSKTSICSEFNILNSDPQKAGSEITYGKRYNLGQLLNIQTDNDDDGNKASSSGNTKQYYHGKDENNKPGVSKDGIYTMTQKDVANWNGKIYGKSVYINGDKKTISQEQIDKLKVHEKYVELPPKKK